MTSTGPYCVEKRAEDVAGRLWAVVDRRTGQEFQRWLLERFAINQMHDLNERHIQREQQAFADMLNGYDPLHAVTAAHASTDDEDDDPLEGWISVDAVKHTSSPEPGRSCVQVKLPGSEEWTDFDLVADDPEPAPYQRYSVVVEGGTIEPGEQARYLIHDHVERRTVYATAVAEHAHKLRDLFEADTRAAFEAAWGTLSEDDDEDTDTPLADRLIAEADRLDAGQSPGLVSFRWMAAMLRDLALAAKATDAKDLQQALDRREVMG